MNKWLARIDVPKLVAVACWLGLAAMALMTWSVVDPTPFPVMVAMSVGQVIGTLSLVSYLAAVLLHSLRKRDAARSGPRT